jgi:predicted PurR-regulated permease PerM
MSSTLPTDATIPKRSVARAGGANQFLFFVVLSTVVLYFGRPLLIPLTAAAFLAMLMAPICRWLETKITRPLAVIVCILLLLVIILGILAIVLAEFSSFMDDLSDIEKKGNEIMKSLELTIQSHFGVAPERQVAIAKEHLKNMGQSAGSYMGRVAGGITGLFGGLVIMLVYTFLLLYHRERYATFFVKLFGKRDPERTRDIIENVTSVGQHYVKGRTISILLLGVVYISGFLIVGVKSAMVLGAIAALLSIIPYLGAIIGGIFPLFMALSTGDSATIMGVVIVIIIAHGLSTYLIEPLVVGSHLRLSALSMIVIIIAGGALWGISGMILFIPILAMAKILCDHVDALKPYGYLVSDPDEGKPSVISDWIERVWARMFKGGRAKKNHGV